MPEDQFEGKTMQRASKKSTVEVAKGSEQVKPNSVFRRAMKETWPVVKFVAKHPILTAAIVSTVLVAFNRNEAKAQDKPVPVVNMAKQIYKTSLKDGQLFFEGLGNVDVKDIVKMITGNENASEKDVIRKINTVRSDIGPGVYYIFEKGILGAFVNKDGNSVTFGVGGHDAIFTHEGAIYVTENGLIFASSPTTLLMVTPSGVISTRYEDDFGKVPLLKRPIFTKGSGADHVDLRDPVMGKLKMQISVIDGVLETMEDNQVLGAR